MKIMIWFHFYSQWNNFIIKSQLFPKFFSFSLFNLFLNCKSYMKLLKRMNWLIWLLWMSISSFNSFIVIFSVSWIEEKKKSRRKFSYSSFFKEKIFKKLGEIILNFRDISDISNVCFFIVKIQKKNPSSWILGFCFLKFFSKIFVKNLTFEFLPRYSISFCTRSIFRKMLFFVLLMLRILIS